MDTSNCPKMALLMERQVLKYSYSDAVHPDQLDFDIISCTVGI